jgi:hypothetical protein
MSVSCQRDIMNFRVLWKVGNLLFRREIISFWRRSFLYCDHNHHLLHYHLCPDALIFPPFFPIFLFIFRFSFTFRIFSSCFRFNLLSFLFPLFYFSRLYYALVFLVLVLNKALCFPFNCPSFLLPGARVCERHFTGERFTLTARWHSSEMSVCEHEMGTEKYFFENTTRKQKLYTSMETKNFINLPVHNTFLYFRSLTSSLLSLIFGRSSG